MRSALAAGIAASVWAAWWAPAAGAADIAELRQSFAHPPGDSRIMVRWWWFGGAVEKPELERELRAMKDAGIGGVEIQPVYPLVLDDPARGLVNTPYLSARFLDALRFANDKARELGLRVDLTLCSGWPYGGPHIAPDVAAGKLRVEHLTAAPGADSAPMPKIAADEKFLAAFEGERRISEITDSTIRAHSVTVFIASRTHQAVKRATVGAEGPVLDHYSLPAIEKHLAAVGDRLMQAFGNHPPYAIFSDSLEVYGSDWTADFLAEFQKRRGYDLTPYLPALAGGTGEKVMSVRHDWGLTLSELADEHYLAPLHAWAAKHGTKLRSQTYGTPPVNLSSNALVDLAEGEGSFWHRFTATRWAASANHLLGRPVTSSETFTWLHSPVFRATPLDVKAEADLHFLEGVNQIVCHGWPYSPPQVGEPGWHFYAAAVFNPHNPWWLAMPDMSAYLERVSFLLRQGQPVTDVALYLPTHDAYARFTLGNVSVNEALEGLIGPRVIPQILDGGYSFDYIDDAAIARLGIPYPVLIVPNVERMPLATLERIREYVDRGGIAIATGRLPALAPGMADAPDAAKVRELATALFRGPRFLQDDSRLGQALRGLLTPDVATAPEIGFVHRSLPFADVYFLANTGNRRVHREAAFRAKGAMRTWWNPYDGTVSATEPGNLIDLDLAPYESRVLVFSKLSVPAERAAATGAAGDIDLASHWKVTFAGAQQPMLMGKLQSWTELPDRKFYSGTATYEKTVKLTGAQHPRYLDFGEGTPVTVDERRAGAGMRAMLESPVREAAVVYVNGQRAGAVWHPPYRVDVSSLLHEGENSIRIVVANLAINELAGQPVPDLRPLTAKYGKRFEDQDMRNLQPLPSGILGGVRLVGAR